MATKKNIALKNETLSSMETLLNQYKRGRMSDAEFNKTMRMHMTNLNESVDYNEYLDGIGVSGVSPR